jgi:hypothetical protein
VSRSIVSHQGLRRDGPREVGRRRNRETDQPPGDEEAAHRDLDLVGWCQAPCEWACRQRSHRHDGHGQRRSCRRAVPALDEQQDEQEQRRGECGRQQSKGEVGTQRRTMSVRCGRWYGGHGERGWDCQHCHRHLHHEDRLPRERLRQQSTHHRAARRADHACRHPRCDTATLAVLRDQELEAADQRRSAAHGLHATGSDQDVDRPRRRARRG